MQAAGKRARARVCVCTRALGKGAACRLLRTGVARLYATASERGTPRCSTAVSVAGSSARCGVVI